jgi:cation diffusion facilitator family transporter
MDSQTNDYGNDRNNLLRNRQIILASWIGIGLNALLAVAKIAIGIGDNSFAVISDGVDSGVDILTSVITLLAAGLMMRPPNKQFPYGYSRVDPLATKVLSFFIFFSGIQLITVAGKNLFLLITSGESVLSAASYELPGMPAMAVTLISVAVKGWYKIGLGRRIGSAMLVADGQNMRLDIITSVVVLFSLIIGRLTGLAIIDGVTGILVSLWIIRIAISIFLETNIELMDGMQDTGVYQRIFKALEPIAGLSNPHRLRVRKMGHLLLIVMDIEVPPDMSIAEAHGIGLEAERLIRSRVENIYDIIIHFDPLGLDEEDEKFGLSADKL